MATADISEYWSLARDASGQIAQVVAEPSFVDQQLTIGSEVKSAAFKGSFIRLHVDAACRIQFGLNPTASSATMRLAAGTTQYFGVIPGHKISVISDAVASDALLVEAGDSLLVEAGDELLVE